MSQKPARNTDIPDNGGSAPIVETPRSTRPASGMEVALARRILRQLGIGDVHIVLWDGQRVSAGSHEPMATVFLRERGCLYRLLTNPELHFGDDYTAGRIEVDGPLIDLLV
ncbi:MAG: hypothetical protein U9R74_12115, partial [Pseudomonadota bacterium]|nr:hypothetical protein [Pseudomonadota bacterium]